MPKPVHDEGEQLCKSCGHKKQLREFHRRKSEAFGKRYTYRDTCKSCMKLKEALEKADDLPMEFYLPI